MAEAIKKEKKEQLVNQMQKDLTKDEAMEVILWYIMHTEELEEQVKEISSQRDRAIELLLHLEEQLKNHPTIHLTSHFRK
jgi:hypothetical protein